MYITNQHINTSTVIKKDNKIKWDSIYTSFKSTLENKNLIEQALIESDGVNLCFKRSEWVKLEKFKALIELFAKYNNLLNAKESSTISLVLL